MFCPMQSINSGDSAPSERPVSPDKLYRVAILKKRFADTILKAQEKTLKQVCNMINVFVVPSYLCLNYIPVSISLYEPCYLSFWSTG